MTRATLRSVEVQTAKMQRAPRRILRFHLPAVLRWLKAPDCDLPGEILTVSDLSKRLKVSRSWIYDAILRGMPFVDVSLRDRQPKAGA